MYGWTPDQIGRLSLPQLAMYLGGKEKKAKRGRKMTPEQLVAWMSRRAPVKP